MSKQYEKVIRNFFSDYVCWLLSVSVLFVFSFIIIIIVGGNVNGFVWFVPVAFLIIYSLSYRFLILHCKVRKDLKYNDVDKLSIKILKVEKEDKFTFKSQGGAALGKRKYRIIDENGNCYLLSSANSKDTFIMFDPDPAFSLQIEVLKKSRLVLSMKIIENSKIIKEKLLTNC